MVVMTKSKLEHISLVKHHSRPSNSFLETIPTIDLSLSDQTANMVRACEELGFFKVINHGVNPGTIAKLEAETEKFFSKSQLDKERCSYYGNKTIGPNGDVGWLEYLLMHAATSDIKSPSPQTTHHTYLLCCLRDYIAELKRLTCEILEKMTVEMRCRQRDALSRLVKDKESDSMFRVNYYPPCPSGQNSMTGFGEHTDPQIISVLRSNNTNGLQISLTDGRWVSVPSDRNSFFVIVGDSLQVLTNGRFRSVRHRVVANSQNPRVSMIYFGGPANGERIGPMSMLMEEGEESNYREFTWSEYKMSAYKSKLSDNRLRQFQKHR